MLTITAGTVINHFTAAELLSRTDLTRTQIQPHVDYNDSLTLEAVPLIDLLATFPLKGFDRLAASATDGFVAQIPLALIERAKAEVRSHGSPSRPKIGKNLDATAKARVPPTLPPSGDLDALNAYLRQMPASGFDKRVLGHRRCCVPNWRAFQTIESRC